MKELLRHSRNALGWDLWLGEHPGGVRDETLQVKSLTEPRTFSQHFWDGH